MRPWFLTMETHLSMYAPQTTTTGAVRAAGDRPPPHPIPWALTPRSAGAALATSLRGSCATNHDAGAARSYESLPFTQNNCGRRRRRGHGLLFVGIVCRTRRRRARADDCCRTVARAHSLHGSRRLLLATCFGLTRTLRGERRDVVQKLARTRNVERIAVAPRCRVTPATSKAHLASRFTLGRRLLGHPSDARRSRLPPPFQGVNRLRDFTQRSFAERGDQIEHEIICEIAHFAPTLRCATCRGKVLCNLIDRRPQVACTACAVCTIISHIY